MRALVVWDPTTIGTMSGKLHPDEVPIDVELVGRLVGHTFPEWAELPITRVESGGTVHAVYRLGTEMSVRLPLAVWAWNRSSANSVGCPNSRPICPLRFRGPLAAANPTVAIPSHGRFIDGSRGRWQFPSTWLMLVAPPSR